MAKRFYFVGFRFKIFISEIVLKGSVQGFGFGYGNILSKTLKANEVASALRTHNRQ